MTKEKKGKLHQKFLENSLEVAQLNTELLYNPAILLLRHLTKRNKTYSHVRVHTAMYITAHS